MFKSVLKITQVTLPVEVRGDKERGGSQENLLLDNALRIA
jgi:hypothetical protein